MPFLISAEMSRNSCLMDSKGECGIAGASTGEGAAVGEQTEMSCDNNKQKRNQNKRTYELRFACFGFTRVFEQDGTKGRRKRRHTGKDMAALHSAHSKCLCDHHHVKLSWVERELGASVGKAKPAVGVAVAFGTNYQRTCRPSQGNWEQTDAAAKAEKESTTQQTISMGSIIN